MRLMCTYSSFPHFGHGISACAYWGRDSVDPGGRDRAGLPASGHSSSLSLHPSAPWKSSQYQMLREFAMEVAEKSGSSLGCCSGLRCV